MCVRCNVLRMMFEAIRWGRRSATINSISPVIIITPLANDELHGPRITWVDEGTTVTFATCFVKKHDLDLKKSLDQ